MFHYSINAYSFSSAYCGCQSSIYAFTNHGDTESTEKIFLPDRETAIGQEIAALRAGSSTPVASCQRLETG